VPIDVDPRIVKLSDVANSLGRCAGAGDFDGLMDELKPPAFTMSILPQVSKQVFRIST
jgi:hypothetical protein